MDSATLRAKSTLACGHFQISFFSTPRNREEGKKEKQLGKEWGRSESKLEEIAMEISCFSYDFKKATFKLPLSVDFNAVTEVAQKEIFDMPDQPKVLKYPFVSPFIMQIVSWHFGFISPVSEVG